MDALEATVIPECTLCALVDIEIPHRDWSKPSYKPIDAIRKHELLHGACRRCDDPNIPDLARCCDLCQHLRLKHFLLCSDSVATEKQITIRWSRSATTTTCEFCDFLAKYKDITGDITLRMTHLPDMPDWPVVYLDEARRVALFSITPKRNHLRVVPYIDWTWAKAWIEELPNAEPQYPAEIWTIIFSFNFSSESCSNVRVVDVVRRCVVPLPPDARYVALSYVWGADLDSSKQFQLSTSNVRILERPGSLQDIILPATISDAMLACNKLGQSYLWIDRLCIIQDGSWDHKSLQLNQMAIIYNQAVLTIVAGEGDSAEHGLVGVSRPRCSPVVFQFNESVGLVEGIPSLDNILEKAQWATRGWTYQEYLASDKLLFFTKHSLFLSLQQANGIMVFTEGPPRSNVRFYSKISSLHNVLEDYTQKVLTHPTDILRALAGILYATEGRRTTYGIPWKGFSSYILWSPVQCDKSPRKSAGSDIFPTWSWTSAYGPINFGNFWDNVYSLAYWGINSAEYSGTPNQARWKPFGMDTTVPVTDALEMVVLAWLNGCVRSKVPGWFNLDYSDLKNIESLKTRWREDGSYWNDMFGGYANLKVFDAIDIGEAVVEGKLAVHTQTATFVLDKSHHDQGIRKNFVRTCNRNNIAGGIKFDRQPMDTTNTQFTIIAISVGDRKIADPEWTIQRSLPYMDNDLSISQFYGCACCHSDGDQIGLKHLVECPKHEDFWEPVPFQQHEFRRLMFFTPEERSTAPVQAFAKHLWDATHIKGYGSLTSRVESPPMVNVMVIAPCSVQSGSTIVYERLGIGEIYLKRWLEASRKFETFVLA